MRGAFCFQGLSGPELWGTWRDDFLVFGSAVPALRQAGVRLLKFRVVGVEIFGEISSDAIAPVCFATEYIYI